MLTKPIMDATTHLTMRPGFSLKVISFIARALRYCRTITMPVATFLKNITVSFMSRLTRLFEKLCRGQAKEPDWLKNLLKVSWENYSTPDQQEEWDVDSQSSNLYPSLHPSGMDLQAEMWDVDSDADCALMPEKSIAHVHTQEHQPGDEDWDVDSEVQETPTFHPSAMKFLTEPGAQRFLSLYTLGNLLGSGGFGSVYEAVRKHDGLQVAIKYIPKDLAEFYITIPGESVELPLEVALMQMTSKAPHCENVLQLLDCFDMPNSLLLVLERPIPCMDVLELCMQKGGMLEEPLAKIIMQQVVKAAQHCQSQRVFHRDIKEENLLFNTDTLNVKLIDFGCGDLWQDTPYRIYAGTPSFWPPEWVLHKEYYAHHATVWSLGVLLFSLVCGEEPFLTEDEIVNGTLHYKPGLSESCRHLIEWCLQQDPTKRPSLEQISEHKWFREGL